MNAQTSTEEEKPLDPATEKVRKKLVKFSAVFMGLNMLALMAVLVAIVYKIGGYGEQAAPALGNVTQAGIPVEPGFEHVVDLPDGTIIVSASQDNGQVLLNLLFSDGQRALWFYNLGTGQISGKLTVQ